MSDAAIDWLVRYLRRRQDGCAPAGNGDRELLERFVVQRDETAFAALVRRHGPMVRGLCRRLLGDPGLADDVFQATFLALARRAGSIRQRESLASWLYGVARRLALKVRRADARRRWHECRAAASRSRTTSPDPGWAELLAVLDEELSRLPEDARAPLLLCYFGGYTQDEAARFLGWSLATLRRRLERGRDLLRVRMTRRGATLAGGLCAALLAPPAATAAVSDGLAGALARAAGEFAAGKAANSAAVALAQSALGPWWPTPLKALMIILLTLGIVTAGAGGRAYLTPDDRPFDPTPPAARAPASPSGSGTGLRDRLGDPLPEGALARFGSTRFRHPPVIDAADLAPDGRVIATERDGVLRLTDTATGRARLVLSAPELPVGYTPGMRLLAFSPDGKLLLVPGTPGVRFLDAATGKEVRRLGEAKGPEMGIAFSPDGKQVAVADVGGATFYEATTGKEQRRVPLAGNWVGW